MSQSCVDNEDNVIGASEIGRCLGMMWGHWFGRCILRNLIPSPVLGAGMAGAEMELVGRPVEKTIMPDG